MLLFSNKEDYLNHFERILENTSKKDSELEDYISNLFNHFNDLIRNISEENFWSLFPTILGIDAKLNLISELLKYEDFSNQEIISMAEEDYTTYFKELCGYDLTMKTKGSLIFNVL